MASKKVYDVIAVTGEYQNNFGETKKRYQKCGVVFQGERGLSMKLEALPVGNEWNGWLFLAEPRDNREQSRGGGGYSAPAGREQAPADEFGDIPFISAKGVR